MKGRHKLNTIGESVTLVEDIMQCYETIFKTRKGSVVCNPNLGWDVMEFLGKPLNLVQGRMQTALLNELNKQEPRAIAVKTNFSYSSAADFANGRLTVEIYFSLKNKDEIYKEVITL